MSDTDHKYSNQEIQTAMELLNASSDMPPAEKLELIMYLLNAGLLKNVPWYKKLWHKYSDRLIIITVNVIGWMITYAIVHLFIYMLYGFYKSY